MSDKNFKVKNGLTIEGTVDTVITADNAGGILVGGSALSSYSAPTLGSTSIASGATVTTVAGLTLTSPTISADSITVTDTWEDQNKSGMYYIQPAEDAFYIISYGWSVAFDKPVGSLLRISGTGNSNGVYPKIATPLGGANAAYFDTSSNPSFTTNEADLLNATFQFITQGTATISSTEIGYLDGVTSRIQTQLDGKVDESIITAKGDLYVGSASSTLDNLAVGTNGYLLTADSNEALGVKWAAAPISLPSQTGNTGKYLTTNGTSASWATVSGGASESIHSFAMIG
jgi:hypothetical protein